MKLCSVYIVASTCAVVIAFSMLGDHPLATACVAYNQASIALH